MSTISAAAPGLKTAVSGETAVRELETRLRDTQQSVVRQRMAVGLLALAASLMLALAVVALVDYFAELGFALRAAWLLCALGAAAIAGGIGWKRHIAPYTLTRAAVDAEGHIVGFGQRLRTTLDYDQQNPPPAQANKMLLSALQRDTYEVARKTSWDDVVDVRPTFLAFSAAALVAFTLCIALICSGEYRVALGRALLLPVDYTTVTYAPQTQIVRIGESAEIRATVAGRPIDSAVIRYRTAGSQDDWTTLDLSPVVEEGESGNFDRESPPLPPLTKGGSTGLLGELAAKLDDLQHDLEFEVVAGPRPLPLGTIQVLQPLTLEDTQSRIVPPAYTSRPEESVKGLDLKVLEGSTIELTLKLNRAAAEAKATFSDSSAESIDFPLTVSGDSIRGTLADLRKSGSWTITARAADGMLLEPQRLSIRVQLDRKPEVKFIEPPEELVATATTEVPMTIEAGDDIGLHKVGILFQVNDGEMQVLCEQDAAGASEPFSLSQALLLEEHRLTHKDSVTYYAFAEDRYFDDVRRTTTPLRFIDIRPFQTSFQIVEGGGSCNGCSTTLEELIVRQRRNLNEAFAAQDQSPVDTEMADRLHEGQAELLEKTREFEQGIAQLAGPIPTLASAVANMQAAVDALVTKQVPGAVGAEKQALADLIRARENVRKKLSQSNSQSASACRKFDREQRQKLRMPEKKQQQDKQQQVADLRKKLDDLAKQERKWSQECQQCNNPNSSGKPSQSSKSASQAQSASQKPSDQQQQASQESQQKEGQQDQQTAQQSGQKQGEQQSEPRTPAELAQEQQKLRAELDKLRERLDKLTAAKAAARDQAQKADESMAQSLQELDKQDGTAASKEGERSAERLERLADHLAAMNAGDFGQRLDQAQKLARQLSDRQSELERQQENQSPGSAGPKSSNEKPGHEKPGNERLGKEKSGNKPSSDGKAQAGQAARNERDLAGQADLLADQLDALVRDASREKGDVQSKLRSVQAENPPRDISSLMRGAASDLESNRKEQAGRGIGQARQRLEELSRSLGEIHNEFSQPQLEELIALEQQLANLIEQSKRAGQGQDKVSAATQQKWSELDNRLEQVARGDKRLAHALHRMRQGVTPEGHFSWLELADFNGPREVGKVLQMKIQEAILAGALQDADQPIPAEYKALVEKYYRALSDDLR